MSEVNIELVGQVLQSIRNNPKAHDQSIWVGAMTAGYKEADKFVIQNTRISMEDLLVATGSCQTTACIAGWALLHNEFVATECRSISANVQYSHLMDPDGDRYAYSEVGVKAAEYLGIDKMPYGQLFNDYVDERAIAQLMYLYVNGELPSAIATDQDEDGEVVDYTVDEIEPEEIMEFDYLLLAGMHEEDFTREWYKRFEEAFTPMPQKLIHA